MKYRQFSTTRNYIGKEHQNDVDHSLIEVTSTKHVKMMWKFADIDLLTNFDIDSTC